MRTKANCNTIAKITGSREFDDWTGKTIHLYRTEVEFGGEMVESIRVKLKASKPVPASPDSAGDDQEIPFWENKPTNEK